MQRVESDEFARFVASCVTDGRRGERSTRPGGAEGGVVPAAALRGISDPAAWLGAEPM
jgi:hypothetical protein